MRKQLNPAKIEEDFEDKSSSTPTFENMNKLESKGPAEVSRGEANSTPSVFERPNSVLDVMAEQSAILASSIFGPFSARRATEMDPVLYRLKICDLHGEHVDFLLLNSEQSILDQLKSADSIQNSNCIVFEKDSNLYLYVTKSVNSVEELKAIFVNISDDALNDGSIPLDVIKKFKCGQCNVKFTSFEKLQNHQTYYCTNQVTSGPSATARIINSTPLLVPQLLPSTGSQMSKSAYSTPSTSIPSTSMDNGFIDLRFPTPTPILLPVAFHESGENVVQIIGPPQMIVPVAIHRSATTISSPLLIASQFTPNLTEIAPEIKIVQPSSSSNHDFSLPIAFFNPAKISRNITPDILINTSSPSLLAHKRKSDTIDAKPLDLSVKSESETAAKPSKQAKQTTLHVESIEKPYACDCGVSFSVFQTFIGHKKYYCRNLPHNNDETQRLPQPKIPSQCSHCDFRPSSASQLTHHVRTNHTSIQAYICLLCAYKGYSARGIKSHLKNAHSDEIDGNAIEARFTEYVFAMTTDAKLFPCAKCNLSFPTKELVQKHSCAEANLNSTIEN